MLVRSVSNKWSGANKQGCKAYLWQSGGIGNITHGCNKKSWRGRGGRQRKTKYLGRCVFMDWKNIQKDSRNIFYYVSFWGASQLFPSPILCINCFSAKAKTTSSAHKNFYRSRMFFFPVCPCPLTISTAIFEIHIKKHKRNHSYYFVSCYIQQVQCPAQTPSASLNHQQTSSKVQHWTAQY